MFLLVVILFVVQAGHVALAKEDVQDWEAVSRVGGEGQAPIVADVDFSDRARGCVWDAK